MHNSLVGAIAMLPTAMAAPTSQNITMVTDWSQLAPVSEVQWTPCFANFTCMRLQVPLDYANASVGTAAIAFVKFAAANETKNTKNILFNPGGPGGSGIDMVMTRAATAFTTMFGAEHNFIGFDPRGVQHSEPSVDCFHGDRKLASNFAWGYNENSPVLSTENLNAMFRRYGDYSDFCSKQLNESARYVGTMAVATDLLTFAEKQEQANGGDPKDAKLYYAGYSYGTILGSTFASMFPNRVGGLMIDGVSSLAEYYAGTWTSSMWTADDAIKSLFKYCHAAGPQQCAFYNDTAEAIEIRYRQLLARLRDDPIAVSDLSVVEVPGVWATFSALRVAFFRAAYSPEDSFPAFAQVLVDLENRNGSSLVAMLGGGPCYECDTSKIAWQGDLAGIAIACLDRDGRFPINTKEEWKRIFTAQMSMSELAGETGMTIQCRNWAFHPPPSQQFTGKIGSNTSTPLLILSNTIDPATPLISAQEMHSAFPGSALLVNEAVGHATFNAPSDCVFKHIKEYFSSGALPPVNTTCKPNTYPFL
ncbi:TAP-like protein-domain-containing protein [Lophiotrema nucula]|uniref:TAP-like protein-domain-containing protein n=1 Tax=Lophiotrema nucula TaxID=690887 RepID=A0A6A5Z1X1_9PLEO|nr:TAP-like protein-domain-containing protein [Lophiotrema nucula]